jgi:hypothetical protein
VKESLPKVRTEKSESRSQAGQRRKPQRPYEGASQRSDGLTLPEARLLAESGRALEFDTASVLKEPVLMGPRARLQPMVCAAFPVPVVY